jgi:hypothetical protein
MERLGAEMRDAAVLGPDGAVEIVAGIRGEPSAYELDERDLNVGRK